MYPLGDQHYMRTSAVERFLQVVFECAFCFLTLLYPPMHKNGHLPEIRMFKHCSYIFRDC